MGPERSFRDVQHEKSATAQAIPPDELPAPSERGRRAVSCPGARARRLRPSTR